MMGLRSTPMPPSMIRSLILPRLGHCRADHPERLDRDRTIGMDEVRAVEIDQIDVVEVEIDGGIGVLRNPIIAES